MAKYTENIRLAQPEGSDYYDIEVFKFMYFYIRI